MNKMILILIFSFFQLISAQSENDISTFHRLLILNSNNELMVVKIQDANFWVTPGFYQNSNQTIKQGLDSIASTYGLKTESPQLKGIFLLQREVNGMESTSVRNIYIMKVKERQLKKPTGISEIKWLSPTKAIEIISFPHINAMIEQIVKYPNQVWGGTLLQYKQNDTWKAKVIEAFYPL